MMRKYIGFLQADARGIVLNPDQIIEGDSRMWCCANPVHVSNHDLTLKQLMENRIVVYETSDKYNDDIVVLEADNFRESDKREFMGYAEKRIQYLHEKARGHKEERYLAEIEGLEGLKEVLNQRVDITCEMSAEEIARILSES